MTILPKSSPIKEHQIDDTGGLVTFHDGSQVAYYNIHWYKGNLYTTRPLGSINWNTWYIL